ncbi:MAG: hypothetical protein AB4911_22920, partial [Oscillochloridaceae bacterium umkhey_bin13]|jgi:hypothetical protein
MKMHVLIEHKPEGKVTASLIGWPGITAQGGTEAEAVSALRRSFTAQLHDAKVISIDFTVERSWLQTAGMFKDDPFADELATVIAEYRRERDATDAPEATQDHAA